jgi:hypothetical protein
MRLANNPTEARRMGAAGKLFCHSFSLEAMVEQLGHLYDELILSSCKTVELSVDDGTLKPENRVEHAQPDDRATFPLPDYSSSSRYNSEKKKAI